MSEKARRAWVGSIVAVACACAATLSLGGLAPAAADQVAVPASSGRTSGPASVVADAGATGGQALGFGTTTPAAGGFRHPGIVLDQAQLDFVRSKVAAGAEPWASAYANLFAPRSGMGSGGQYSSLTYQDKPVPEVRCVANGADTSLEAGCQALKDDSIAAYTDALIWSYTGDVAYAQKSVSIMNDWSATLQRIAFDSTYSNGLLVAGWSAESIVRAAEIIRAGYDGWSAPDVARFSDMLTRVYLPNVNHGWTGGAANWLMTLSDATINIGVFTDSRATFDLGVSQWRANLPAMIYRSTDVNPYPKLAGYPIAPPGTIYDGPNVAKSKIDTYWSNPTAYVDGLENEVCHDLVHPTMGYDAMIAAAETARLQGVDLYAGNTDRIVRGMEHSASTFSQVLATGKTPDGLCQGSISSSNSGYQLGWETAFNTLHNRLGLAMPATQSFLEQYVRPRTYKAGIFMAWEQLTSADSGSVCAAPDRSRGATDLTVTVPTSGTYRVWTRVKAVDDPTFSVQVDRGCAVRAGGSGTTAGDWAWVGTRAGTGSVPLTLDLSAGQHTLTLSGTSPGLRVDRVLLTDDTTCVPVGDASACTPDSTAPSPPAGLAAEQVSSQAVELSWTAATDDVGVDHYVVRRDGEALRATSGDTTTFADETVSPGTTYSYAVVAVDAAGHESPASDPLEVRTPPAPHPVSVPTVPTDLRVAAPSGTGLTLAWTPSHDEDGTVDHYDVRRDGTRVAQVVQPSFTDSGLTPATGYSYTVSAVDDDGNASAEVGTVATTLDTVAPTAPAGLRVAGVTTSSVGLAWSAATDNVAVTRYGVYRAGARIGTTSGTAFTDSGLPPGTPYAYSVVAEDAAGNTSPPSSAVTAATATPPDTTAPTKPGALTARVSGLGQVTLSWGAATDGVGVVGYRVSRGGTALPAPTGLSATDSGLAAGTSYSYSVVAVDAAGNAGAPVTASVTTALDAAPRGAGFAGAYFANTTLSGPAIGRLDPTIGFSWGTASPVPGIGTSSYSVRWTGRLTPTRSGSYTFTTQTHDGVRLYLGDAVLVDHWSAGTGSYSKTVSLTAGTGYNLRMEYYQTTGAAAASLSWAGPGIAKSLVPASVMSSASAGLSASYFSNDSLTGTPTLQRLDPGVSFAWGTGRPDPRLPADGFSARWTGKVVAPKTASYTFSTDSDEGIRLWVNGQRLVDSWTAHALATSTAAKVDLVAGTSYDIRVEYYDRTSTATAKLMWAYGTTTRTPVPASALRDR